MSFPIDMPRRLHGTPLPEDMAKKWIAGAIKRPGAFRAKAKAAGMSTAAYASKMSSAGGRTGRQARLAQTLMGMNKGGR